MASSYTTNLHLDQPARGDDVNTWDTPVNGNSGILDNVLGGQSAQAFSSTDITLTVAQAAYFNFVCSGTLSANVKLILPATIGGRRVVTNNCSGAFTLKVLNGASDAGNGVVCAQGANTPILLTQGRAYIDSLGNVNGPASSTANHVALFNNTSGTLLSDSGLAVPGSAFVGVDDSQTLTNKTLTGPVTTNATGTTQAVGNNSTLLATTAFVQVQGAKQPSASGLVVTNDGATPNTKIDVTANYAQLVSPSNGSVGVSSVSVVINCGVTGANGLDTGGLVGSTWYNIFLISNGSTIAGLVSLSATAPTMPGGYSYLMRVGAMRTDGSSNFLRTIQKGAEAQYQLVAASNTTVLPTIDSGTHTSWHAASVSAIVPPTATRITANVQAVGSFSIYGALAPNNAYATNGSWAGGGEMPPFWFSTGAGGSGDAQGLAGGSMVLESSNIYYLANTNSNAGAFCRGWTDAVLAA